MFEDDELFTPCHSDMEGTKRIKPNDTNSVAKCKESLTDIQKWIRTNKLKLNDDKTEVALFGTRQQMEKLKENDTFEIKIGSEIIKQSPSARNLGFYMESQLKSQTHITKSVAQHSALWRMWQGPITC